MSPLPENPSNGKRPSLATVLTIGVASLAGLLGLAGYYFQEPAFAYLRGLLLQGGVALAGVAMVAAAVGYFLGQVRRARSNPGERLYGTAGSVAFLLAAGLTLWQGSSGTSAMWLLNSLIAPAESALLACLAVLLLSGMVRLLANRRSRFTWIFFLTTFICLAGSLSVGGNGQIVLGQMLTWIRTVPAAGGVRGLLLGAALGGIVAGLRVLMGFERPYHGGA